MTPSQLKQTITQGETTTVQFKIGTEMVVFSNTQKYLKIYPK
jgi:hypothetical protein